VLISREVKPLDLERIQAISVRAVVESDWLELAHELPSGRQTQ
jgi:hypothetical protein